MVRKTPSSTLDTSTVEGEGEERVFVTMSTLKSSSAWTRRIAVPSGTGGGEHGFYLQNALGLSRELFMEASSTLRTIKASSGF